MVDVINVNELFTRLKKLEKRHRGRSEKYEVAFADGVQQSMNEVTGILEEIRFQGR